MPKSFYPINNFSGGLNNAFDPRDISDAEMSEAQNIILDERNAVKTMGGEAEHSDVPSNQAGILCPGYGVFAFESDHVKGSSAKDTGENWLAVMDAINVSLDLYDQTSDAFTASVVDLGTAQSYASGSGNIDFPTTSTMTDSGDGFLDPAGDGSWYFKKGDIISLTGSTTTKANNLYAIRIIKVVAGTITVEGAPFSVQNTELGSVTIKLLSQGIFYFADEALRVADATFSAGTQPYWYGYIKRKHFNGTTTVDSYDNWYSKTNGLVAPTELRVETSSGYPAAGNGFRIKLTTGSANTGTFEATAYQFAASFIYDDNQESLLYVPTSNNTHTPGNANCKLTLELRAVSPFDPRISGARIYIRKNATSESWSLFTDINLRDGARMQMADQYNAWADGATGSTDAKVIGMEILSPNVETYEILNGFLPNETQISISGNGEGYKTAVIANRRCFVANVKTLNNDNEIVHMRDRIMYTPVGKFDTFPRSYFIDVVRGDAEEFVRLEEFADRLLAFKNRKVYVINISNPSPTNWFIEEVKDFAGVDHHSAVTKTELGICWANAYGCFIYDGQKIVNLILNKIKESVWQNFVGIGTTISYIPKRFYLVVLKDCFANNGDIYLYDFRTQSWVLGDSAFGDDYNRSNPVIDWNNNMTTVYSIKGSGATYWESGPGWEANNNLWEQGSDVFNTREWADGNTSETTKAAGSFVLTTKDIDFGDSSRAKKIYSVVCTYKSDNDQTQPIYYDTDGGTSFSNQFTGNFLGTGTGWKKLRATLSTPVSCQSVKIKVSNPTTDTGTSEGLQINDIAVEYRPIYKRIS